MPLCHRYCHQLEPGIPRDPCVPSLGLPLVPVSRLLSAIPSAPAQVSLAGNQSKLVGHTWHSQFPNFQFLSCSVETMCFKALCIWCVTLMVTLGCITCCQLRQTCLQGLDAQMGTVSLKEGALFPLQSDCHHPDKGEVGLKC